MNAEEPHHCSRDIIRRTELDYLENYYYGAERAESDVRKKAFSLLLPFIMKQELTERQYICIKYKYDSGKSQEEIARLMNLSQPTVSRHINSAKRILNRYLKYCYAAVTAALAEYEKL